jgi:outer membrane protein assembly factor BamB
MTRAYATLKRPRRLGVRAVLVAFACCAVASPRLVAQERAFDGWDAIIDREYVHDPDRSDVATFALQNTARARVLVDEAHAAIARGDFKSACQPLQDLINLYPSHVFQVADRPPRYVGAAEYAKFLLGSFPPEEQQVYAEFARLRSATQWRTISTTRDTTKLVEFVRFFEMTPEGRIALERLGRLAFERGDAELAAVYLGRSLAFSELLDEDEAAKVGALAAAIAAYSNQDAKARTLLDQFVGDDVRIGSEASPARETIARFAESVPERPRAWPIIGGDNTHTALAEFDPASLTFASRWETDSFSGDFNPWYRPSRDRDAFPFHPVVGPDVVVLNDGLSVRAWSFYSANPKWRYDGPLARQVGGSQISFEELASERSFNSRRDSEFGSLARSLQHAATIAGGLAIVPMLESVTSTNEIEFDMTRITTPIPRRALHAIDVHTGKLVWTQRRDDTSSQDFVNRVSIGAAPIVIGDRVYAAGYVLEGAINVYVTCFDLNTGKLVWKMPVLVGQQELTMFNKSFKEFTLQMLGAADGSLFVCTNLGLMASIDAVSGNPRWFAEYDSLPIRGSHHYRRTSERQRYWTNDPPLIVDGVVVVTPLDSEYAFGFEAATGKRLWRVESDQGHSFEYCSLLGAARGAVVFAGSNGIGFHDLRRGSLIGSQAYAHRSWAGRGTIGDGVVHQPLIEGLLEVKFDVGPLGVRTDARLLDWACDEPGNLVLHRDFQIVSSARRLTVYYDLDELIARVRERLLTSGATPTDRIDLGELLSLRGEFEVAIEEFGAALNSPVASVAEVRRARDRLSAAHRDAADRAAESGDQATVVKHRLLEAEYAVEDFAFLRTCEQLIRLLEAIDPNRIESVLAKIDARCPGAEYPFQGSLYGGSIPAGLFTLDRRAIYALGRRDVTAAVGYWQAMIERYRTFVFPGGSAGAYAERMIGDAIAKHGRGVYAKFDVAANEEHRTAAADPAGLTALIERFPNAEVVVSARLDLASARLARRDFSSVFRVLAPLLAGGAAESERQNALLLVARSAVGAGDHVLGRLVLERLVKDGRGIACHDGSAPDLASAAARELAAVPAGIVGDAEIGLVGLPDPEYRSLDLGGARTFLVPLQFDRADRVLIYSERELGADSAELRRIDLATMQDVWRVTVPAYFSEIDRPSGFAAGDRIVFRQRGWLLGLDAATGETRFESRLDSNPLAVTSTGSLLYALVSPLMQGPTTLVAIETTTGMTLWQKTLGFETMTLRSAADLVIAVGTRNDPRLIALDALTGAERYSVSNLDYKTGFDARPFERYSVLLTVGATDPRSGKKALAGFDLADGRPLWRDVVVSSNFAFEWLQPYGDSLLLPSGTTKGMRSAPRGITELQILAPRQGEVRTAVPGLQNLRAFDEGVAVAGDRLLLVAGESSSKKSRSDRVIVTEVAAGKVGTTIQLDAIPRAQTYYEVAATRSGELYGLIRTTRNIALGEPDRMYLFTYTPADDVFDVTEIKNVAEGASPASAATSAHFAVVRGTVLYVFPTRNP